jgi:O-antigen/teichoic acid export membrane protein
MVIILVFFHSLERDFDSTVFFVGCDIALAAALIFQLICVLPKVLRERQRSTAHGEAAAWIARSVKMWFSALVDTTSQHLEVVVIGLVLGPSIAALYFVITRVTNVFAMISASFAAYAVRKISILFYSNATSELQNVLRFLAILSTSVVAGSVVVVLIFGQQLLWIFGAGYVIAYPALVVMTTGAALNALAGPAQHLLLLTGNEGAYPRIMAAGLAVRFVLIVALGPVMGLMGAAIAWSVSAAAIAFGLTIASRRLVGLDPSSLSIFAQLVPQRSIVTGVQ